MKKAARRRRFASLRLPGGLVCNGGLRLLGGEWLERRDCPATVGVVGPASVAESDAGFVDATFAVSLSAPLTEAASVGYSVVSGGGAGPGIDYVVPAGASGRIAFAPGETSKSLIVRVRGDTVRETTESFSVRLTRPVGCTVGAGIAMTSIVDNDSYTLSIEAPTTVFVEGSTVSVELKLSSPATRFERVSFRTVDGTARGGMDFGRVPARVVTFSPGEQAKTVSVASFADNFVEGPEFFQILARPLDPRVGPEVGARVFIGEVVTSSPALVSVTANVPSASEAGLAAGRFRFVREGDLTASLVVSYSIAGDALPGADYDPLPGVVTFAAGEAAAEVVVTPVDDSLVEATESVAVALRVDPSYVLGPAKTATVTIASDDVTPPGPTPPGPTPPTTEAKGFQVTFVLPAGIPADANRMFTQAGQQWTAVLEDVVGVRDSAGNLVVDDFELVVEFRSGPRDVTDPLYIPWQQLGFGGATFTQRRPGDRGLPFRGRAEITDKALKPEFFQKMKPEYDKFSMYKTMELIGRALGFDKELIDRGAAFDLVRYIRYPQLGINYGHPVIRDDSNAASRYTGRIREVPLNKQTWDEGIAHWSSSQVFSSLFGGTGFGFDVFVAGWETRSRVDGDTRPKISNVTRGLFQDLGYGVRYSR